MTTDDLFKGTDPEMQRLRTVCISQEAVYLYFGCKK